MFRHVEVVAPFGENSWLIGCPDTGAAALIDPGGHIAELLAIASQQGLRVEQIWLTHAHIDHVTGVAEAVRETGAPLALHPLDRPLYDAVEQQATMFGLHVEPLPAPDRWLETDETMTLGKLRAHVLHVPGHAPGHVAFWFADLGIVVSGDCLFAGSIGRTDLPGGSYDTLMQSIRTVLLPLGDAVTVLPGHGPETTLGRERRTNPFLVEGP
ncbi:MAG TPA: MBL fold metallo-hydrolase [Acidobacteriota bacterium]|nr:MBL fold metallo-hydrolase [Acidobacteriota bacterium]